MADPPRDVVIVAGTAYRPYNALFRGTAANRTGVATFTVQPSRRTVELRVLSTLIDGVQIEQDTPVAEVTLVGDRWLAATCPASGGRPHCRERLRPPGRAATFAAPRPAVAGTIPDIDPSGLPDPDERLPRHLRLRPDRRGGGRDPPVVSGRAHAVFGIGLVDAGGTVRSIFSTDRAEVPDDLEAGRHRRLQNDRAFPRAYVVPEGIRRTRSDDSALVRMTLAAVRRGRQVTLEDGAVRRAAAG